MNSPTQTTNSPPAKSSGFNIYGPISKKYCLYFYILQVIFIVLFVLALLTTIGLLLYGKRYDIIITLIYLSILYLVMYLQNRLLYNMCIQSI